MESGKGVDDFSQAFQGAEISHAGGGFGQPERLSDFLVIELLVVPHQDDLTVLIAKQVDCRFDLCRQFFLGGGCSRCERSISKLVRQFHGGLVRRSLARLRLFPVDTPLGGQAMPTVGIDDPILCDLPDPKMEGDDGIGHVVLQASVRFHEDILNYIADVHPLVEPLVEPELDHPSERVAVAVHESIDRFRLPLPCVLKKFCGYIAIRPNRLRHPISHAHNH